MTQIPLIDITEARTGDRGKKRKVATQIARACVEIGFFTIKGHGIDKQIIARAYESLKAFFALESEEKNSCRTEERLVPHQRDGYSALLEENAHALSGKKDMPGDSVEKFSIGQWILEDKKDLPFPKSDFGEEFRQHLKAYYQACEEVARLMTELFAIASDLPEDFFVNKMDKACDFLRCHGYPSISADSTQGFAAHKDGPLLTLLTDTCPGLEVKTREGDWIVAETKELDHFVVNIGDLMMRWTNDEWLSNLHRVTLGVEERWAMAFFKVINEDTVIETFPKFCDGKESKYDPILFSKYMNERAKTFYAEKESE